MRSVKNHTEIIKGSNCNQISILEGSHHDLDTITVQQNLGLRSHGNDNGTNTGKIIFKKECVGLRPGICL